MLEEILNKEIVEYINSQWSYTSSSGERKDFIGMKDKDEEREFFNFVLNNLIRQSIVLDRLSWSSSIDLRSMIDDTAFELSYKELNKSWIELKLSIEENKDV
jgi:hypothetical protein